MCIYIYIHIMIVIDYLYVYMNNLNVLYIYIIYIYILIYIYMYMLKKVCHYGLSLQSTVFPEVSSLKHGRCSMHMASAVAACNKPCLGSDPR